MEEVFEEDGGMMMAFLGGIVIIGVLAALGESGGSIYEFVVGNCIRAV